MAFPIIGSLAVWSDWNAYGTGAWNMWFMAPYGSWMYCGFVKNNVPSFKKIDIGVDDGNYPIYSWAFGDVLLNPSTIFPDEQHDGYPDGSTNLGCIRETLGGAAPIPKLYLVGRSSSSPSVDFCRISRFVLDDGFEQEDTDYLVPAVGGNVLSVDHIAGIDVVPPGGSGTEAVYLVTNNRAGSSFRLLRYDYADFDGGASHDALVKSLTPDYMQNNSAARIRGIGHASDGNILVFINTGLSATQCKVLKFDADTLAYLGTTSWTPNISTATWAYLVQSGEVFFHFQGLNSTSTLDWKSAVYYDRSTGIPDAGRSNLVIGENLTAFGDDNPITLAYHAKDDFNMDVAGVYCRFYITGEDYTDSTTWTDRVSSIQEDQSELVNEFFNEDGVPTATSARTITAANGIALAYYKPMRSGTGSQRNSISIICPAGA